MWDGYEACIPYKTMYDLRYLTYMNLPLHWNFFLVQYSWYSLLALMLLHPRYVSDNTKCCCKLLSRILHHTQQRSCLAIVGDDAVTFDELFHLLLLEEGKWWCNRKWQLVMKQEQWLQGICSYPLSLILWVVDHVFSTTTTTKFTS